MQVLSHGYWGSEFSEPHLILDVTEEYTSKNCTSCGHVHVKLGASKQFKFPNCGHFLPRDWNGTLGILLKALH